MDAVNENQAVDGEDDFKSEEDQRSSTKEEQVEATQNRADTLRTIQSSSSSYNPHRPPPPVVDFLRKFLYQRGMKETLDCLQAEWNEVAQRGPVDAALFGAVPDVYTENLRLEIMLKTARQEREGYRQEARVAADALLRVQKVRDEHRMQHQRVLQETKRLTDEMKRLKVRRDSYETTLKRMNEKYQALLKQNMAALVLAGTGNPETDPAGPSLLSANSNTPLI